MKNAAGITGILLGLLSLVKVGLIGSIVGSAAGWLGALGPGNAQVAQWAVIVKALSLIAPILCILGGIITFRIPMLGGLAMGGSALAHWGLLGFGAIGNLFIFPIGIAAIIAFISSTADGEAVPAASSQPAPATAPPIAPAVAYDQVKWDALVKYDRDIAAAVHRISPYGPFWIDELASAYLAIGDKAYLPEIERKIMVDAKAQADGAAAADRASSGAPMPESAIQFSEESVQPPSPNAVAAGELAGEMFAKLRHVAGVLILAALCMALILGYRWYSTHRQQETAAVNDDAVDGRRRIIVQACDAQVGTRIGIERDEFMKACMHP